MHIDDIQISWNNIKPCLFIYPPCTHHFSFTRCVFPAVSCWSPPGGLPLPVVFPLPAWTWPTWGFCSPPAASSGWLDLLSIATIYPQFSPFQPCFWSFWMLVFCKVPRVRHEHVTLELSTIVTWERRSIDSWQAGWNTPVHLGGSTHFGPPSTCHELSTFYPLVN